MKFDHEGVRKRGNASALRPVNYTGRDSLMSMGESHISSLHPKISYTGLKEKYLSPTLRSIGKP